MDDDALVFAEDGAPEESTGTGLARWRVLVVDDDPDVHAATAFALREVRILDRQIELLSAHSAGEAQAVLRREPEIAVVLLDVVMEQDDAGLRLVRVIRQDLQLADLRIVLRTGQPGYAPEIEAIRDYDINDYKTKSELTRTKLFTTLTAAVRSYDQIRSVKRHRSALDALVLAVSHLSPHARTDAYAEAALGNLARLLELPDDEPLLCVGESTEGPEPLHGVLAARGAWQPESGRALADLGDSSLRAALQQAVTHGNCRSATARVEVFSGQRCRMLIAVRPGVLDDDDRARLFSLFCRHMMVGLDNVQILEHLRGQAFTDRLTGLPNRLSLIAMLDARLEAPDRAQRTLALIDIDGFAETNDALGHAFGDQLLRAVARRMMGALGERCQLARMTGDTFAAVGLSEELMPTSLLTLFAAPFVIEEQEVMVTVTIGIAHLADIDGNGIDALKGASLALRRAKTGARGEFSFYSRDMAVEIRERVRLLQALRGAVERQRLFLVFQPQVRLADGKACGLEALLRWRDEDGQLIPPDRFIPIAEYSGLIVSIGEWVLRAACFQQAALARHGFGRLRMAINVSVIQLRHPRFLSVLRTALEDSGADPASIELEVTESVARQDTDFIAHMIDQIKTLGVLIALDDFGTGFSSLSCLQFLRLDRLKIDRSFVANLARDGSGRRIPELVVQLGQTLGLTVVAEGVEVEEQAAALRELGCEEAQGYHYARPMEVAHLLEWLSARR